MVRNIDAELIIIRAKPLLRAGRLDDAVFQIVTDIHNILQAGPTGIAEADPLIELVVKFVFFCLYFLYKGCSWCCSRQQRADRARVQELLTRLQVAYQPHAQSSAVQPPGQEGSVVLPDDGMPLASQMSVCPVCLEDFPRSGSADGSNASAPTPDAPSAHNHLAAGATAGATADATAAADGRDAAAALSPPLPVIVQL
ncbi:hypothetical protein EON62_00375, partial [archaeon]